MDDSRDDLDDLDDLEQKRIELEARFRELEQEAEIERLRAEGGAAPQRSATDERSATDDPLAATKAALEHEAEAEAERYLIVLCPHCAAKNRVSLTRVRTLVPVCGACKQQLASAKT